MPRPTAALAVPLAALALLAGCVPLPDVRAPAPEPAAAPRVDPAAVPVASVEVPGVDLPATPDRFDAQTTLRWALDEPIDTVVIAVPGLFGGAGQFAPLARRLVAHAPGVAVWAVDRRGNRLEDADARRRALDGAPLADVAETFLPGADDALGYRAPDPDAHRFVADWGLDVHHGDLAAVVRAARAEADRVVLLGHSLGASLAATYASWEDAAPVDALVLVDGAPGRTGAFGLEDGVRVFGVSVGLPDRAALAAGDVPPWLPFGPDGRVAARRFASAVLADRAPDATAPAIVAPFPVSNEAFYGLANDDQYQPFQASYASIGEATDADLDGNLTAFLFGGGGLASRAASVVGVAPGAARVGWTAGDPALERSDLAEQAKTWLHPDADAAEWYLPSALLLDLVALPPDLVGAPGYRPQADVGLPTLVVGSDRGLLRDREAFAGYLAQREGWPVTLTILEGLTHVDLLAADRNPLAPLAARWLSRLP